MSASSLRAITPALGGSPTSQNSSNSDGNNRNNTEAFKKTRIRAKRSCDYCRERKTRCDSDIHQPCTKCKLAHVDCLFLVERKKRGPAPGKSYVELLENRLLRLEELVQAAAERGKINQSNEKEENIAAQSLQQENNGSDGGESVTQTTTGSMCSSDLEQHELEKGMELLCISGYQSTRYLGASSGFHLLDDGGFPPNTVCRIPEDPDWFIIKMNNEKEEHIIMKAKDTTEVPRCNKSNAPPVNLIELFKDVPHVSQELVDYLIHIYFTSVHIYCPIINKVQFLEQYYYHSPSPPDKYLLYTVAYVGTCVLKRKPQEQDRFDLTSEKMDELEQSMYAHAYSLMDIVYKQSTISTLQTLLLLSMFVGNQAEDSEENVHWFTTGMAIRMAQDLGLHRDCSQWKIPKYEIEMRRRIWFSTYILDRWVASELGRPLSIIDHEFDVQLPSPYELDYTSSIRLKGDSPVLGLIAEVEESRREKRPVYTLFIQMSTLSQIIGQILVGLHSPRAKRDRFTSHSFVHTFERSLAKWKDSLPSELQISTSSETRYCTKLLWTLYLSYVCVLSLLYRPFMNTTKARPEDAALARKALKVCTDGAVDTLEAVETLLNDSSVVLPWNMTAYCIFQASITFLYNAKGKDDTLRRQGKNYLIRCHKILTEDPNLKTRHTTKVLSFIIKNAGINVEEEDTSSQDRFSNSPRSDRHDIHNDSYQNSKGFQDYPSDSAWRLPNSEARDTLYAHNALYSMEQMSRQVFEPTRATDHANISQLPTTGPNAPHLNGDVSDDLFYALMLPHEPDNSAFKMTQEKQHLTDNINFGSNSLAPADPMEFLDSGNLQSTTAAPFCSIDGNQQLQQTPCGAYHNEPVYLGQQIGPQSTHLDMNNQSSQLPLWNVPSSTCWAEWEMFLKNNAASRIN